MSTIFAWTIIIFFVGWFGYCGGKEHGFHEFVKKFFE